ncbi:hypothetical protein HYALB_00008104 [Hymenoscyphus albidus]|uniref:DNA repair protein REV1 n=1 Tax=Hymenoscyphus albidus TaxID=595503 RepID=A0A9N9M218_9HELO|nr:hypothetical protein HYALB_00008104 [Hymenoscyphus albidus]
MGTQLEKNSKSVLKRIEAHTFEDEEGEEYEGSKFGGFSDYFRRKKLKLQNLDADVRSSSIASGKPQIFKGVCCHVNGYTQPSLNDLHHMIVSHGGAFMQYLDGKTTVTHIIASNLTPKKAVEFRKYRIVKPAWIVDSIAAGKLLAWNSFRVLDEGVGQRVLGFNGGKVISHAGTQSRSYRDQTNTSWYTSQVKNVAEDIDDNEQFPSTQPALPGGNLSYSRFQDETRQSIEETSGNQHKNQKATQSSSTSFELSSSLEDALKNAVSTENLSKEKWNAPGFDCLNAEEPVTDYPDTLGLLHARDRNLDDQPDNIIRKRSLDVEPHSPSKKAKVMTAEEHNAILLENPHVRKSTTANPEFIKQYYSESRLHHLSTWKADLKSRFQQMASERSASQKRILKRKPGARRYILHVDFDSFFCAVSLKNAPEYVGKPAVVAHGNGTGSEIASCNYPARAFGVKNGMWMKNALTLCPDIKVLPYDFPAYEEASQGFYEAVLNVGGVVQSVSVDEALIDATNLCLPSGGTEGLGAHQGSMWAEQERADEIAKDLRDKIKQKTGCAVSVGIGGNILLAKVALRKAKPAGQHHIKPEEILNFMGELSVRDLPGVAHSVGGKLEEIGVKLVKEARQLTKERLVTTLGPKTGEKIYEYSRGIDRTEVGEQVVRKSVSAEVNWGIRFISQAEAEEFVQNLCVELQRRLVDQQVKGRQLTVKIMKKAADAPLDPPKHLGHGKCDTYNKSVVLGVATIKAEVIGREAISILRSYGFSPGELRGLGVQMTKLDRVKVTNDALPDGSQRRINFGLPAPRKQDPINDPVTPKKPKPGPLLSSSRSGSYDSIDSPTPQKPTAAINRSSRRDDLIYSSPLKARATPIHPAAAIARANAADESAKKVLNITGTQFIIPSQIDPEVLAELPQDIRSKLLAQHQKKRSSDSPTPAPGSRSHTPTREASNPPLPSQFDPEVFESLPEDLKAEVLASYSLNLPPKEAAAQTLLPQSPRKIRTLPPNTKKTTPTKKKGLLFRGRKSKQEYSNSTLTQSNFIAGSKKDTTANEEGYTSDGPDPAFLAALPPEMQEEILAEHRRLRLAKRGNLSTSLHIKRGATKPAETVAQVQRRVRLPKRPPRPTFTTKQLSTLPELRDTLKEWYEEFESEGPHEEDVAAMERYLVRVVGEERDLSKVVGVVKWMGWLVGESKEGKGRDSWAEAVEGIKERVQGAVRERGLGALELE